MNMIFVRRSLGLLMLGMMVGCDAAPSDSSHPVKGAVSNGAVSNGAGVIQLEIDFVGRKENLRIDVPCQPPLSVFQVLESAQEQGNLTFESTGRGETAFISAIGGVKNEGAAGDNWVFRVNQQLGDRGSGVFQVNSGDQLLWTFGKYTPSESPAD